MRNTSLTDTKKPRYAVATMKAALGAGADIIVLCDTNGGTMTHELTETIIESVTIVPPHRLGIHAHNDCGLAVANSSQPPGQGSRWSRERSTASGSGAATPT